MKKISKTLSTRLNDPLVKNILDKSLPISNSDIDKVINFWNMDLFSRKPGPAYKDGVFVGTDLDLAVFLYALVDRNAVINIPTYKSMTVKKVTEGQRRIEGDRFGQILSLVSNKDTFSFSIRIKDMSVITTNDVGDYRTFSLTRPDGNWYEGWKTIGFMPERKENQFLTESNLWSGNRLIFKNFIHPNRWTSFYGQYYFTTKLMIQRLKEEAKFLNTEIKRMLTEGVEYKEGESQFVKEWPDREEVSEKKSIKIKAFEVEIDIPDNKIEYTKIENSPENLKSITDRRRTLLNRAERLQFMVRATEFAFHKHMEKHGINLFPSWITDTKWEEDYVQKGKRKKWNRLVLFQPERDKKGKFQNGVAIRCREYDKSIRVNLDYKE